MMQQISTQAHPRASSRDTFRPMRKAIRRGFSLLEVLIVVLVLGILAGIVVPQAGQASQTAKESSAKSSLATFRAGIASFRANAVLAGGAPYPTVAQLSTAETVVSGELPANPFNESRLVQVVSQSQAAARSVSGSAGWNYYVDNSATPPVAIIYLNSNQTVTNNAGESVTANQL